MRQILLAVLTLALVFTTLPTLAASPALAGDAEPSDTLVMPVPIPAMSPASPATVATCGEDALFANAAEATAAGFTAPLQGGPCTGVSCTSHYECQQYCGAAGGRCGFPDCEPNTCYCFF